MHSEMNSCWASKFQRRTAVRLEMTFGAQVLIVNCERDGRFPDVCTSTKGILTRVVRFSTEYSARAPLTYFKNSCNPQKRTPTAAF